MRIALDAADAGLAHAARDDRGVRGHAAARGHDALGGVHAVNVLRARLDPDQDRFSSGLTQSLRFVGGEHDLAARRAGRSGQTGRDRRGLGVRVDRRVQQLIERGRLDPRHRVLARNEAFVRHLDRDLKRSLRRALAVAGLQHPQFAALDRELEVLHVLVMLFQKLGRVGELLEDVRHQRLERGPVGMGGLARRLGDVLGRADAGDHVLALGVDEKFAVERVLAGRGVAGESDAGRRRLAHVAEHHRLHIDCGAPVGGNGVEAAIGDGALVHPGREDRADRAPELVARSLRERLAGLLDDPRLVIGDDSAPVRGVKVGVERIALAFLVLLEDVLEIVDVDVKHDVRVHLNEATIGVVSETRVVRRFRQSFDRVVVQPEVEDSVHHAGHRGARARPHRDKQRIGRAAECAPRQAADLGDRRVDLAPKVFRIGLAVGVEVGADFGGDGEAGRHGQAERGHLVQVRALAAEQVLHLRPAFRALGAEGVDPLRHQSALQYRAKDLGALRPARATPCRNSPILPRETGGRRRAGCPKHKRCRAASD